MNRIHAPAHRAGFTLLEMLVVAAIAMVIFIAGFTAISGTALARSTSVNRVRAVESGRLFFQMLERDMAGAYPGYNVAVKAQIGYRGVLSGTDPASGMPLASTIDTDDIQFFTTTDSDGIRNQTLAVRYYVNNFGQLCRIVVPYVYDPANPVPASLPPVYDSTTSPATDERAIDSYAMFEDVYAMNVSYDRWDPVAKTFKVVYKWDNPSATFVPINAADAGSPTHLHVMLRLFDRTGASKDTPVQSLPQRTYDKRIAIPAAFRN